MRKITFLFITIFLFVITSSTQAQKTLQVVISDTIGIPCNGGTGSATALASDGIVPYTYLWLPDSNTGPIDSNLVGGTTYTIMAIDADSNSAFTYLTLTQPTQIVITIDSLRNVKCPGDCIGFARITASGGIPPYKYLWLPDGDTTTVDSNMCSGNYTVLVTDSNGCSVKIPLTINTLSELSASTAATNVSCFGLFNGATAATETGGVPPYQFVWSPGGATTASVMGLSAGTYTVTITDALGCHTQSTAGVSQPTPIVLTAAAIANIAAAYVSGGTAPYTYNWYPHVSTTSIATGLSAGVYTVTVHDANLCSDSAIVSVSSLYPLLLYFGNGTTSCGKASYYDFDVMASSASQNNFNNCVVDIQYPMSEFGGDNVSNGGVTVTQGLDCLYSIGDNDYNILNTVNLSDSVIEITFGSDTAVSPRGSDPFNHIRLLHVKLRIRNSCGTGPISFVNTSYTDTTGYSSLIFPDTVCHNCALPCDSFGRYCCNYDSLGNCTLGGLDMVYTSATYSPLSLCSLDSILIPCPRNCIDPTLSVPDILENSNDLKLFPNPANSGDITIAYTLKENAYVQFKVYDCIGKEVIKMTFEHKTVGNYSERINVANLAKGVYLFTANINGDCQTIKFIKT